MKRAKSRQRKPRVSRAKWSTQLTRVGAKVKLTAELTGNDPEDAPDADLTTARFLIHEYSGKPPQQGGGFRLEEIETIDAEVEFGASSVSATWTVTLGDEPARDGEVPEYRFTVEWAGTKAVSKLLKFGEVTRVRWSPLGASNPPPKGYANCEARLDEGKSIGIEVVTKGLQGFVCDVEIHQDQPGPLRLPIATLTGIPIRSGVARSRWQMPPDRATELSGARLQLVAKVRNGSKIYTPRRSRSKLACFITPRRVYFALYYVVRDQAFRRAAETWLWELKATPAWSPRCDVILKGMRKENDFRTAWDVIHDGMAASGMSMEIVEGHVFTHASRHTENDGIEFEDGTFDRGDIRDASVLAWSQEEGLLVLHGCNTGVTRWIGWSPAGEFARRQRVRTIGQGGTSYMSRQDEQYDEIDPTTVRVYLWAYRRGRNAPSGDGAKIPGIDHGAVVALPRKTSRSAARVDDQKRAPRA